ncbi:hypothetical protein AB4Z54_47690, partial [Streptomyces sp. MCAF7]
MPDEAQPLSAAQPAEPTAVAKSTAAPEVPKNGEASPRPEPSAPRPPAERTSGSRPAPAPRPL